MCFLCVSIFLCALVGALVCVCFRVRVQNPSRFPKTQPTLPVIRTRFPGPFLVIPRVNRLCVGRCLWGPWAPRSESCFGSRARPRGSRGISHTLSSYGGIPGRLPWEQRQQQARSGWMWNDQTARSLLSSAPLYLQESSMIIAKWCFGTWPWRRSLWQRKWLWNLPSGRMTVLTGHNKTSRTSHHSRVYNKMEGFFQAETGTSPACSIDQNRNI